MIAEIRDSASLYLVNLVRELPGLLAVKCVGV